MQKLTVGRSPFPFQIIKEPAAKLVLRPYAQHRGERLGVTAAHGKVAVKPDGSRSSGGLGPGYGKFNAGKRAFPLADQWAARYGALHGQGGILQINQLDFLQIHLLGRFNPVGFLDVGGTLPQFRLPVNRQPAVFVPENGGNNGPFRPFPQAEAGGMPFQCADGGNSFHHKPGGGEIVGWRPFRPWRPAPCSRFPGESACCRPPSMRRSEYCCSTYKHPLPGGRRGLPVLFPDRLRTQRLSESKRRNRQPGQLPAGMMSA